MRIFALLILALTTAPTCGQTPSARIAAGTKAPSFILRDGNTIQSITMPYMKKIIVVHFWNPDDILCDLYNDWLRRLSKKYRDAAFSNADGFEVIAVAVHPDRETWKRSITEDTLEGFVNGIAQRGLAEEACLKYNVSEVPNL